MSDTPLQLSETRFAWRQFARKGLPKRSAAERVADWLEIYGPYDEATAREQASRCIQCAEPMCVSGCPLGNRIPEWMLLTAEGQFLEASMVLQSSNNVPDLCTRICPANHLCEGACILNGKVEPVSIGALEQFLNEYAFAHHVVNSNVAAPNGLRVAVVGSGPAGLACADELSRRGYTVTVYDSELVPGGLLVHGIPAFKLEDSVLQRRLRTLESRGTVFRLGVKIGEDFTLEQLRREFSAVFLALEAQEARALAIPGSTLKGVVQALPFIMQHHGLLPPALESIDVRNCRVLVIGGGDTALDCARTAVRAGAREVVCAYRRDEASLPCSHAEYANAVEEGVQFRFLVAPTTITGNSQGWVTSVRLARTELGPPNTEGRATLQILPGTEFQLATDWVFTALGFDPAPLPRTSEFEMLNRNGWGGLQVDDRQKTSLPGVFAGGPIVRGPGLLLNAVRDARRAAASIDQFLRPAS